jgi:hypothetical protein
MLETLSCWYRQAKFELLLIEGIIIQIWFKLKKWVISWIYHKQFCQTMNKIVGQHWNEY